MTLLTPALRMTVFVGETDQVHHRPLYTEIVHRAHARGLAGATVLHGCEGYGASSKIHTTRILSLAEGLPVVIVIVDTPERIRAFVPEIEDLVPEGLITLDEVEVVGSVGRAGRVTPRGQDGEGPPIDVRSPRPGADRERR